MNTLIRFRIRKAAMADKAAILKINNAVLDCPFEEDWLDRILAESPDKVLVAVREETVLGFLTFICREEGVYITYMGVDSEIQRCGIDKALLKKVIDALPDHGKNQIRLHVKASNLAAISFYEAAGFRPAAQINNYYGKGKPAFLMRFDTHSLQSLLNGS